MENFHAGLPPKNGKRGEKKTRLKKMVIGCLYLGFASLVVGKSSKNIIPNGGGKMVMYHGRE